MARNISVISSDIDGADLRRRERANPHFTRCKGKDDDGNIQEALSSYNKERQYTINSDAWERIFGSKK